MASHRHQPTTKYTDDSKKADTKGSHTEQKQASKKPHTRPIAKRYDKGSFTLLYEDQDQSTSWIPFKQTDLTMENVKR